MPTRFIRSVAIASLISLATACSSTRFPASPVPAPLTDMQAAHLADVYQIAHKSPPMTLMSARAGSDGYLLAYETAFRDDQKPAKESHLFLVRHDGDVRELKFK